MDGFKTYIWLLLPCLLVTQAAARNPQVDLGYVQYQGINNRTLGYVNLSQSSLHSDDSELWF